jgi:hypothetical protein
MGLIFCVYLSFRNALLAKRKGQNTVVWVLITAVAFFLASAIGVAIVLALFYQGPLEAKALQSFWLDDPLREITSVFAGIGGYLLIRYLLDRMPDRPAGNNP